MNKVSKASLIIGIIFIVASTVAFGFGICNIDGYRTSYNYGYVRYSQYTSSNLGLALVIIGSSLFIGGILMVLASILTYKKQETVENKQEQEPIIIPESEN